MHINPRNKKYKYIYMDCTIFLCSIPGRELAYNSSSLFFLHQKYLTGKSKELKVYICV